MKIWINILFFLFVVGCSVNVQAEEYRINPYISEAAFKLDHAVGFSSGFIKKFSGSVDIDENIIKSLSLKLDMDSVTTFNEKRDAMLKGAGFFDITHHPSVVMKSKKITRDTITFEVLAKETKNNLTFNYRFLGFVDDVNIAQRKAIVALTGSVSRNDLGVSHNVQDESGSNLLGDTLELFFALEAFE